MNWGLIGWILFSTRVDFCFKNNYTYNCDEVMRYEC